MSEGGPVLVPFAGSPLDGRWFVLDSPLRPEFRVLELRADRRSDGGTPRGSPRPRLVSCELPGEGDCRHRTA